jgi:hypothetical protein
MHKNKGKQQQIRGHKRRIKILNMQKRRNPNAVKPNPGEKYINNFLGLSNE